MEGGRRRLHSEELHNVYASRNIIKEFKSRGLKWVRHLLHTAQI